MKTNFHHQIWQKRKLPLTTAIILSAGLIQYLPSTSQDSYTLEHNHFLLTNNSSLSNDSHITEDIEKIFNVIQHKYTFDQSNKNILKIPATESINWNKTSPEIY